MRNRTISLLLASAVASGTLAVSGCQTQMQIAEDHAARVLVDVTNAFTLERLGAYAQPAEIMTPAATLQTSVLQKVSSVRTLVRRENAAKPDLDSPSAVPQMPLPSPAVSSDVVSAQGDISESLFSTGTIVEGELEQVMPAPADTAMSKPARDGGNALSDTVTDGGLSAGGQTSGAPAQTADPVVLKRGASGDSVVELQNALAALGYFNASPTGYFGRVTEAAVKAFQRSNSLVADGMAGVSTRTVLAMRAAHFEDAGSA